MPPKKSIPSQLTLRFKQHKTTILLLVAQSQSFTSIKQELLEALKATAVTEINGTPLPSDSESIILGLPVDKNNIGKGWVHLKIPEVEDGDTKGKGVKKGSILNENPLGAGLRDGALVAFKFGDEDGQDGMDDEWDVVMPSYDDENSSQIP
ncbi:hypothetical protein ACLMJK_008602 [Lecanora helva]